MKEDAIVFKADPAWRAAILLPFAFTALISAAVMLAIPGLDRWAHTTLAVDGLVNIIIIFLGIVFVPAAGWGIVILLNLMRLAGQPIVVVDDESVLVRNLRTYRIPWSNIRAVKRAGTVRFAIQVPSVRRFGTHQAPVPADLLLQYRLSTIVMPIPGTTSKKADFIDAFERLCGEKNIPVGVGADPFKRSMIFSQGDPPEPKTGWRFVAVQIGTVLFAAGLLWQAAPGLYGLIAPHLVVENARVERIEVSLSPYRRRPMLQRYEVLTVILADHREQFSIRDYEPGFERVRQSVRSGDRVSIEANSEDKSREGHSILKFTAASRTLMDLTNAWPRIAWDWAVELLNLSCVLMFALLCVMALLARSLQLKARRVSL